MEKYGIKETSEALRFGLRLTNGIVKSLADGKVNYFDAIFFKDAILIFPDAMEDMALIPKELGNLSDEESKELIRIAKEEFLIDSDKIERVVEITLSLVFNLVRLINDIRN